MPHPVAGKYAIDPERGRVYLPGGVDLHDQRVALDFHYGFAMGLGGGEYERQATFATGLETVRTVRAGQSLGDALNAVSVGGVVEVTDNAVFPVAADVGLNAASEAHIEFRSANDRRAILAAGKGLRITGGRDADVSLNGLLIKDGPVQVPATGTDGLAAAGPAPLHPYPWSDPDAGRRARRAG